LNTNIIFLGREHFRARKGPRNGAGPPCGPVSGSIKLQKINDPMSIGSISQMLANKKTARLLVRLKEEYPDIMTPEYINKYIQETERESNCRKLLNELSKRRLISVIDDSLIDNINTVEEFDNLVFKTDILKVISWVELDIKREHPTVWTIGKTSLKLYPIEQSEEWGNRWRIKDVCFEYYLFSNGFNLNNICVYNSKKETYVYYSYDFMSRFYLLRLKQNGFPYFIIRGSVPVLASPEGPENDYYHSLERWIYDFETLKYIRIHDYSEEIGGVWDVAYGSRHIAYFEDNKISIHDHNDILIYVAYNYTEKFYGIHIPTTIENGIMTLFETENHAWEFITYDLNHSQLKRIMALILCKQRTHVPKEIYMNIYRFIAL
jgi:hypothetical protein